MQHATQPYDLFGDVSVLTGAPSTVPISFKRHIVRASAVSQDGLMQIEFDARPVLAQASDEDLQLLADEGFVGAGPGCRRLLERAGADAEAFLMLAERRHLSWELTADTRRALEWIAAQRPQLSLLIDPAMCLG